MFDNGWLYINWNMFPYFKTVVVILKFISSLVVLRNYGKITYWFLSVFHENWMDLLMPLRKRMFSYTLRNQSIIIKESKFGFRQLLWYLYLERWHKNHQHITEAHFLQSPACRLCKTEKQGPQKWHLWYSTSYQRFTRIRVIYIDVKYPFVRQDLYYLTKYSGDKE